MLNRLQEQYPNKIRLFKQELDALIKDTSLKPPIEHYFKKIIKVIEIGNKRIYATIDSKRNVTISVITSDSPRYDYTDEGRVIYRDRFYLTDDVINTSHERRVLERIKKAYPSEKFTIVNQSLYQRAQQKFEFEQKKRDEEEELKNILEAEIEKKVDKLKDRDFEYQGFHFSKSYILYESQKIGGEDINLTRFIKTKLRFNKPIDFNDILNKFIDAIIAEWDAYSTRKQKFILGRVTTEIGKNSINNTEITARERRECLRRALQYESQEQYSQFLKEVNSYSLKAYDYIRNGIDITFKDKKILGDGEATLKLNLTGKDGLVYFMLLGRQIELKNPNKLFRFGAKERIKQAVAYKTLQDFFREECSLNDDEIDGLFKESIEKYKKAMQKSKELLKKVVEQYGCKQEKMVLEREQHTGYTVEGISGRTYFISNLVRGGRVHPVWDISDSKKPLYKCIIDKTTAGVGKDKLVARICALANDRLLSSDITTLSLDQRR